MSVRWLIYDDVYKFKLLYVDDKPQHVSAGHYAVMEVNDIETGDRIYGPWFEREDKTVKCKLCFLQDHTDHRDLDSSVHEGFTIGNGKAMYFMYTWHKSGNASVFPINGNGRRYVRGDVEITIHFK